jgi:hypothetical protein
MQTFHHNNHIELDNHQKLLNELKQSLDNKTTNLSDVANKTLEAITQHHNSIEKQGIMLMCLVEHQAISNSISQY